MPIYEFRCAACSGIFEKLSFPSDEEAGMSCPECGCTFVERVVSRANHAIGGGAAGRQPKITTKTCGSNQCMTLDLPGHAK